MPENTISVLVVLRPASGRLKDIGPISQQNLGAAMPSPDAVKRAQSFFAAQGCKVHPGGSNSFAIEGTPKELAKLFPADELKRLAPTGGDLSLAKLPRDIQELLESVSFSAPPDFGPTQYH